MVINSYKSDIGWDFSKWKFAFLGGVVFGSGLHYFKNETRLQEVFLKHLPNHDTTMEHTNNSCELCEQMKPKYVLQRCAISSLSSGILFCGIYILAPQSWRDFWQVRANNFPI